MVEDLLFLRNVLANAGLAYLLVRGNSDRPVIALDWKQRRKLRAALVDACRDEPFYSMTVDAKKKTSVLVADGELSSNRKSRIFRLYRPRVEPGGGFEFHPSHGEWVRQLRRSGFVIEALHELYAPADGLDHPFYEIVSPEWATAWPAEELWVAVLDQPHR